MDKRIKILYIEQPLNNRGDESAHRGIMHWLNSNRPDIDIEVIFWDESECNIREFIVDNPNNKYTNIKTVKGAHFALINGIKHPLLWDIHPTTHHILSLMKQSDYILCSPGGVNMGGFQSWEHVALLKMAAKINKPTIYYGRSIGPFPTETDKHKSFLKISTELLKNFTYLSVRDRISSQTLHEMGIKHSLTVDCAFLSDVSQTISPDIKSKIGDDYAVVVPNVLHWHYDFKTLPHNRILDFYTNLFRRLRNEFPGLNFVLLPQTYNEISYLRKDFNFFKEIEAVLNDPKIVVLPETIGSDIQQDIIRHAKFMFGSRYHSVIFAINQATPFAALSYEHKIHGLLDILGLSDQGISISASDFNDDDSINQLVENSISRIKNADIEKIKTAQKQAKEMATSKIKELSNIIK